ncbi:uncharacterized protein LOC131622238 [Vicia villosa]|uniref:uncharacterized protein LOC131622238 n=1 Tax=Vicia villosa TaxID=3911 RepID=UPI00273A9DBB|nr:uncharacterized protein LOC131622238 [Vicia villosa]
MNDANRLHHSFSTATTTTTTVQHPVLKDTETLFDQLLFKFYEFFSALPLHNHVLDTGLLPSPDSRLWPLVENLSLVLRRSLVVLTLPYSDITFFTNKCCCVLRILKSFLFVDVTQLHDGTTVLLCHNFVSDVPMEFSDSCRPFLCAVLEVFADELLRHQSLRRYLMTADSVSSDYEKTFVCQFNQGDIVVVLEVISAHFILSVSNEKAFENFISRLYLHSNGDFRSHELGLASAMALLLDPVVYSAPKMFQAHVISLVSEVIGSGLSSENLTLDTSFYLMAFQKSVSLYSKRVSSLQMDSFCIKLSCAYNRTMFERSHPSFESYIQEGTPTRLNQVLSKSNSSLDSYSCKMSSKTKADLLTEYIEYMKGSRYIFADSCRDKAASILDYIIHQAFSQDAAGNVLHVKKNTSAEDIYLLASILKLMSVSLLQVIKCLSNSGDSGCLKTKRSSSVHDEYDSLISIINPFQQFKFCLPIQTLLHNMMKNQQINYQVSKSMFVHFSGLLSLSFYNGFDVLAKGCISVIMALMFMLIFEEGDLFDLVSFKVPPLQSCSSEISLHENGKATESKQVVYKIAAEFQKIRTYNLRSNSVVVDESEKTYNRKKFLDCKLSKREPDYDELADFHDCSEGKDYSRWLNNRKKYRNWKLQKIINSKKIKKVRVWKALRFRKLKSLRFSWKIGKIL